MTANNRKQTTFFGTLAVLVLCWGVSAQATESDASDRQKQPVDLVIALDVSGSMSGLIDSAKQRLWDIVNELAQANPQPDLRMAILTYGNPEYGQQSGYVRIDMPFTRDLDAINKTLFSFDADGGDEYVARVIQRSVTDLTWSQNPGALKILFVAGNEAADQDPQVSIDLASELAVNRGIVVNTIYCGDQSDSIVAGWRSFSSRTNGLFASIDQNAAAVAAIATPQDDELVALNNELNETYVAYGEDGDTKKANQLEQDKNAAAMSAPSVASRTITKIGRLYDNAKWDLVDAFESGTLVEEMDAEQLPEPMRVMSMAERKNYVQELASKREEVTTKIAAVDQQRKDYIAKERAQLEAEGAAGFDAAIIDGVRELAERKGFEF